MKNIIEKIQQAILALQNGDMVIVIDDKNRENEGDFIASAQTMTLANMAKMIRHSSGIICAPITKQLANNCELPIMVHDNHAPFQTNFTITIDAQSTSTGISARDRLATVRQLANKDAKPQDFVRPGHIFPLIARDGGVLERAGHTEAAIDLCLIADLPPIAVIGELMNDDGSVQKGNQIDEFAKNHDCVVISIAELQNYIHANPISRPNMPLNYPAIIGKNPHEKPPLIKVNGTNSQFSVNRIFCVGRNYEAHAQEMGNQIDRESPFYFTKSPQALISSPAQIQYAMGSQNFHYEMEFVAAIHQSGRNIAPNNAMNFVFGYACGCDLTRRDLQNKAKESGKPWDLGKDFHQSAVLGNITPKADFGDITSQKIQLWHNETLKQDADLSQMVWKLPEIIAHLSQFYTLQAGDLIYTGTPAGVGAMQIGDKIRGAISGLCAINFEIIP